VVRLQLGHPFVPVSHDKGPSKPDSTKMIAHPHADDLVDRGWCSPAG
jgi:hypothetical protein